MFLNVVMLVKETNCITHISFWSGEIKRFYTSIIAFFFSLFLKICATFVSNFTVFFFTLEESCGIPK